MGHNLEGTKKKKWVLPVVIVVIIALIIGIVFAVLRFRGAGAGDDMYGMDDDFYVDDSFAGVGASNYYSGIVEAQETQEVQKDASKEIDEIFVQVGDEGRANGEQECRACGFLGPHALPVENGYRDDEGCMVLKLRCNCPISS